MWNCVGWSACRHCCMWNASLACLESPLSIFTLFTFILMGSGLTGYVASTQGPIASSLNVDGLFQSPTWAMKHKKKEKANQKRKEKSEGWKSNSDSASCPEFLSMLVSPLRSWWVCGLCFCLGLDGLTRGWMDGGCSTVAAITQKNVWFFFKPSIRCDHLIGH